MKNNDTNNNMLTTKTNTIMQTSNALDRLRIDQAILRNFVRLLQNKQTNNYINSFVDPKNNGFEVKAGFGFGVYDFITLLQILYYVQHHNKDVVVIGKTTNNVEIAEITINIAEILKQRNITTHKHNRQVCINSIYKIYSTEVILIENNIRYATRYIYEFNDSNNYNNYDYVKLVINKSFIDYCSKNGLYLNIQDIIKYDSYNDKILNHYKSYAIRLHLYLLSQKIRYRKKYYIKTHLTIDEILSVTQIPASSVREQKKMIQRTLQLMHEVNNYMPFFTYDAKHNCYVRDQFPFYDKKIPR